MDKETINTYNLEAESIAKLHSTLTPHRIYKLIKENFIKGAATVDVGCGIGRDTHWLNQHGFPAIGVDGSEEMLKQAAEIYPTNTFIQDFLPELRNLAASQFQNILCSAVLMHLNQDDLNAACSRLLGLLNGNGCLVISFRGTNETDNREKGKLYQPISINEFLNIFTEKGCKIVLHESQTETSRNLVWHNFVFKK
jgi:2-polyprenyl-3-methyl-5-hydroxy-6-metoxy-1,4-benzoquinol methylase